MEYDFRFRLRRNGKEYTVQVFIWDVHPSTMYRWAKTRWGYYQPVHNKKVWGEIHLIRKRLTRDTVVHELGHVLFDWMVTKKINIAKSEENMVKLLDQLYRNFWKEYKANRKKPPAG